MGTRFEFASQEALDLRTRYVFEELSFRQWRDEQHDQDDGNWVVMLEKLKSLLEFLGRSKTPRAMAMRSWCVLYAVRPDLIEHETVERAAARFEVSGQRLCELLAAMKKQTGITYRSKVGQTDAVTQRRVVDAMSAARSAKAARFACRNGGPL